ncbi:glycine cleavage system protein GcvH [Corynebacterium qintianiae]|uniref:Glycine cleavage system H protein n=1 Tax=Corynebacterium qintianiae TaxID=2709392 RepID=A0A7T0KL20_9CORY|nr:glycine cleavage system protein GcvH [Corynebacterium qintianiae]QPK82718.1 glycine cleavage system protein GcvH [Corynebacterium qintianiae]
MANALPQDFSYSEDHEWINAPQDVAEGAVVRVGITSVAADRLGEVVFADLPQVGDEVAAGETCGEIESTKSVSDLYSPVTGTVAAVNEEIDGNFELINKDPFGEGWLFEVTIAAVGPLMNADEYAASNGV